MITKQIIGLVTLGLFITVSLSFADIRNKETDQNEIIENISVVLSAESIAKNSAKIMAKAKKVM